MDATAAIAERETRFGSRFIAGWNSGNRPVNYIFINRNEVPLDKREMVQNMFLLERMMDLSPPGVHEVCTVFNFGGEKKGPSPALGATKEMLDNYDRHYPLQPSLTLLQDMGWAFRAFVNMVWPFIGAEQRARTFTKTGAVAIKEGLFEKEALIKKCGGETEVSLGGEKEGRGRGGRGRGGKELTPPSSSTTTLRTGPSCFAWLRPAARLTSPTG